MIINQGGKLITIDKFSYLDHPFEVIKKCNYLGNTFSAIYSFSNATQSHKDKAIDPFVVTSVLFGLGVLAAMNLHDKHKQPKLLYGGDVLGKFSHLLLNSIAEYPNLFCK